MEGVVLQRVGVLELFFCPRQSQRFRPSGASLYSPGAEGGTKVGLPGPIARFHR